MLEYSFALVLQDALRVGGAANYRVSYVAANQYPDLMIRDVSAQPVLRIEMKTLELVSEEKSANFDALVRDIHPEKDVLCVLLWEWKGQEYEGTSVEFPEVKKGFAFEAHPIAKARDLGWLSQRQEGRAKGIDVVGPVIEDAKESKYLKGEERNMGKLMRILNDEETSVLPEELKEHPAVKDYREFKKFTINAGLAHNAARLLDNLGITPESRDNFAHSPFSIQTAARGVEEGSGREVVIATGPGQLNKRVTASCSQALKETGITSALILVFTDKFSWHVHDYDGTTFIKKSSGKKFGGAESAMRSILGL